MGTVYGDNLILQVAIATVSPRVLSLTQTLQIGGRWPMENAYIMK